MITMQFKAPVGYGVRHKVSQLVYITKRDAVWCSSIPEIRQQVEAVLCVPAISPRQLIREIELGYFKNKLIIVSDVNKAYWGKLKLLLEAKEREAWLVNIEL